jgi:hypothetical protein
VSAKPVPIPTDTVDELTAPPGASSMQAPVPTKVFVFVGVLNVDPTRMNSTKCSPLRVTAPEMPRSTLSGLIEVTWGTSSPTSASSTLTG